MITEIQWTATRRPDGSLAPGYSFNAWSGCTRVSRACASPICYAEASMPSARRGAVWGAHEPRMHAAESYWHQPVLWNRKAEADGVRRKVFAFSMADVFERHAVPSEQVKLDAARERLWSLIAETPWLDWLLLTKRADEMARWATCHPWPENAWAGATMEGVREWDARIDHLLAVPARVHFASVEPMVEPIPEPRRIGGLSWLIVGGASGRGAPLLDLDAVRALVRRCDRTGPAAFVKQMGSEWAIRVGARHPKGGDVNEWPTELRVREFPT